MRRRDLAEYLESKILDGCYRDEEYGLYIDYKTNGLKVLNKNKRIVRDLIREYKSVYEGS